MPEDYTHRKAPSGKEVDNLVLYDKNGVAFTAETGTVKGIKLEQNPSDSKDVIIDGRAQYYTHGDSQTFDTGVDKQLNVGSSDEEVEGYSPSFLLTHVMTSGQFIMMGFRVTVVSYDGDTLESIHVDDLSCGIYYDKDADLCYGTDLKGSSETGSAFDLYLTGPDSGETYKVSMGAELEGFVLTMTATIGTTLTTQVDTFFYEAKDVG